MPRGRFEALSVYKWMSVEFMSHVCVLSPHTSINCTSAGPSHVKKTCILHPPLHIRGYLECSTLCCLLNVSTQTPRAFEGAARNRCGIEVTESGPPKPRPKSTWRKASVMREELAPAQDLAPLTEGETHESSRKIRDWWPRSSMDATAPPGCCCSPPAATLPPLQGSGYPPPPPPLLPFLAFPPPHPLRPPQAKLLPIPLL